MPLTRFAYLKTHGFSPAFFYYGPEGMSAKGDAGDWGKAGNLDTQTVKAGGVSRAQWTICRGTVFGAEVPLMYRVHKHLALNDSLRTPSWDTWFKVIGRLFHLLRMDEVMRTTGDASGLDWCYPVTTTEDAFVVLVHYDGDGPMKCWRL